jgi:hypothetical protein
MGESRNVYKIFVTNLDGRDNAEDLSAGRRMIESWVLKN